MNTLGLMDRLSFIHLLMLTFFVSIYGGHKGVFPTCRVSIMVKRGTTVKKIPQQPVTVSCPVKHCGNSLKVTWIKISNTGKFEQIRNSANVEIRENSSSSLKDELISYLTFKRISVYDDGLYRCQLHGNNHDHLHMGHSINISVSDTYEGVESGGSIAASSLSRAVDVSASWRPYFYICGGIALLVFTLTALTLLQFFGCRQILNYNPTRRQKICTQMIPDLPKCSAPSPPGPQVQYVVNDIYSLKTAQTPPPSGD